MRNKGLLSAVAVFISGLALALIFSRIIKSMLSAARPAQPAWPRPEVPWPMDHQWRAQRMQPPAPERASRSARGVNRPRFRTPRPSTPPKPPRRRLALEKLLLMIEAFAIFLFVAAGITLWNTRRELNEVYRDLQQTDPRLLPTLIAAANPGVLPDTLAQSSPADSWAPPALPTPFPTSTPAAAAVLPPGPTPESDGHAERAAGAVAAMAPVADAATFSNEQWTTTIVVEKGGLVSDRARRLQIPAIGVDSFVFQDYGEDWLKLGVVEIGQQVALGAPGNLVLAGHNDVYGEIFRDLDRLQKGDEVTVLGDSEGYTYVVRETLIVEPDDIWVTLPTSTPTLTLVSCYPYLLGTQRIVVFADLVEMGIN